MTVITIEKLVYQGHGLGFQNGKPIFVPHSLPGDELELDRTYRKKRTTFGVIDRILTPSPYRQESPCPHATTCGGCQISHVSYDNQLKLKTQMLNDMVQRLYPDIPKQPDAIIPSQRTTFFRNKMDFAFGSTPDGVVIGLKKRGSFRDVIATPNCQLQSPESQDILAICTRFFNETPWTTWDYDAHIGDLRYLVIRESKTTNTLMVTLVASTDITKRLTPLIDSLSKKPYISGVLLAINTAISDTSFPQNVQSLYGQDTLTETLLDQHFTISPQSFFQTNPIQANTLFQTMIDHANFAKTDKVLDLYCGTGTIGLLVAPYVQHVIGIEEIPEAIENAKKNAALNNCDNADFFCGRVKNLLKFNQYDVDVAIVDPPRSGMVPKALRRLIEQAPKQIMYISCNPATLLRDLHHFIDAGYTLTTFIPVDMFPHSFHLECIVRLDMVK